MYGCEGSILQLLKLPDGTVKVLVEGIIRVKIIDFKDDDNFITCSYEYINDKSPLDEDLMHLAMTAFRRLEKSYRFAFSAVLTLVHDVVLVTGIYALLGHIFGLQVNSVFIVALLTVIGYSVNDTIVIFDRIRENQIKFPENKYSSNINISINESIIRSLGTSITTLLVLFSM